jgi:hypothetical protein
MLCVPFYFADRDKQACEAWCDNLTDDDMARIREEIANGKMYLTVLQPLQLSKAALFHCRDSSGS